MPSADIVDFAFYSRCGLRFDNPDRLGFRDGKKHLTNAGALTAGSLAFNGADVGCRLRDI